MARIDDNDDPLEPEAYLIAVPEMDNNEYHLQRAAVRASIAISLKRIADRLDDAGDTLKSAAAKARIV